MVIIIIFYQLSLPTKNKGGSLDYSRPLIQILRPSSFCSQNLNEDFKSKLILPVIKIITAQDVITLIALCYI